MAQKRDEKQDKDLSSEDLSVNNNINMKSNSTGSNHNKKNKNKSNKHKRNNNQKQEQQVLNDSDDNKDEKKNELGLENDQHNVELEIFDAIELHHHQSNPTNEPLKIISSLNERVREADKNFIKTNLSKQYKFWSTQPVPQASEDIEGYGEIETKTIDEIRQESYLMPEGFEWCLIDITNDDEITQVYRLLNENYVEDDDNLFRFDYSVDFLRWALTPPDYDPQFHFGVRSKKNKKLYGFISGVPASIRVRDTVIRMVEINFLCVHKSLRSKRLAPVLIKEITRRVNLTGVFQAIYTAGVLLPKPIASCRYYHRSLNPKKLIDIGFSRLSDKMTMSRLIKLNRLPMSSTIPGMRSMVPSDVSAVHQLLSNYLLKFTVAPVYSESELAHWFIPRGNVINSYVVENPQTKEITDFCSFYHLNSSIIGNPNHSKLNAVYSYYNVATSVSLIELMRNSLIFAKQCDVDVFNALNLMDNEQFLQELKFGLGDGRLQYYLFNWRCPMMDPHQLAVVLL